MFIKCFYIVCMLLTCAACSAATGLPPVTSEQVSAHERLARALHIIQRWASGEMVKPADLCEAASIVSMSVAEMQARGVKVRPALSSLLARIQLQCNLLNLGVRYEFDLRKDRLTGIH